MVGLSSGPTIGRTLVCFCGCVWDFSPTKDRATLQQELSYGQSANQLLSIYGVVCLMMNHPGRVKLTISCWVSLWLWVYDWPFFVPPYSWCSPFSQVKLCSMGSPLTPGLQPATSTEQIFTWTYSIHSRQHQLLHLPVFLSHKQRPLLSEETFQDASIPPGLVHLPNKHPMFHYSKPLHYSHSLWSMAKVSAPNHSSLLTNPEPSFTLHFFFSL